MMTQRRYHLLSDYNKVYRFLEEVYQAPRLNSYLLPQFFEYAHTHFYFNYQLAHRFGLWEEEQTLVGVACYEMNLGEAFLSVKAGYDFLLPEMLAYAERELFAIKEDKRRLRVWITDQEPEKQSLLSQNGYQPIHREPVTIFSYDQPFPKLTLPEGFSVISLEEENDFSKIHACLWKGFNHGDSPDDDIDCRIQMQTAPNFRKDLTTVIKAPTGEYACFAGMWLDSGNRYAYLEPLATVPEYRRMGLAAVALTTSMKKTKELGASYCFGGVGPFYPALGFKPICHRELWSKEW